MNEQDQARLASLKQKAKVMGISFHPNIGIDTLSAKINAAMVDAPSQVDTGQIAAPADDSDKPETDRQRNARLRKEANRLVRIRLSNMNPNTREHKGTLADVGNAIVGSFSKFIPFNATDGWHVPHIIVEDLKERKCMVFKTVKDERGRDRRVGELIPEFAVDIMPALTPEELKELSIKQAMAKGQA